VVKKPQKNIYNWLQAIEFFSDIPI